MHSTGWQWAVEPVPISPASLSLLLPLHRLLALYCTVLATSVCCPFLSGAGSEKNWRSVIVTCGNNPEVKAWLLDYSKSELIVCVCMCVRVCVCVCVCVRSVHL